ncbi:MAG: ATP-binding protein [Bacteroidia bacterium]|nr:ATP-binding protein [Bacteroidia bacterium]
MPLLLTSLYIDNYKSFTNFSIGFDPITLLLGGNGSGKSSVFEVLKKLQQLLDGAEAPAVFHAADCTRWSGLTVQRFELVLQQGEEQFQYTLVLEHDDSRTRLRIQEEQLLAGGTLLASFRSGNAQLYRDDGSQGPAYTYDWKRSLIAGIPPHPSNKRLTHFRELVSKILIVKAIPSEIGSHSMSESPYLEDSLRNFASWYRYVSLQDQGTVLEATRTLQGLMEGFSHIDLRQNGESRVLTVNFRTESSRQPVAYRFDELSDGQRQLICLYLLLAFARTQEYVLCLDEPDNYLALPEIQPWLMQLFDDASDGLYQALLITHHPVPINYLTGARAAVWLYRQQHGPVRVSRIAEDAGADGVSVATLVERGWVYEQ